MSKITYIVIDDYGEDDTWKTYSQYGKEFNTVSKAKMFAEAENFHSASIVQCIDGKRVQKVN